MKSGGENFGWVVSVVLHVSVAATAFIGLPMLAREPSPPPPPVTIDFVKIDDRDRVDVPQPKVEAERPVEQTPAESRNEVIEEAAADAVPLPTPVPEVKPEPPAPKRKPQLTDNQRIARKVSPRRKPKPPSRLKSSRLKTLINKELKEEREQVRKAEAAEAEDQPEEVDPLSGLRDKIATATLLTALQQKLEGCWRLPAGAKGIDKMFVKVRIYLAGDGRLSRAPEFVSSVNMNDPFERTFAESARRAVIACEPFTEAKDYVAKGNTYIDFDFDGSGFGASN